MRLAGLIRQYRAFSIGLVLAVVTFALYAPMLRHGFIMLDDNQYVTKNAHVQAGVTWNGVKWAFTNVEASNWHPLTWLSHMLDCQLFGLNAGGHHLVNLLFHIANTLLLFFWLNRTTGALWRSAIVAALFAWNPLRVESVAWVAERKDVLSGFFWLLTLLAWSRYTKKSGAGMYLLALFLFACGLMSKPMVVTLPFVLLLIDYWPLKRFDFAQANVGQRIGKLVLEKILFFVLIVVGSAINVIAQRGGGATWSLNSLPLSVRVENAFVSYTRYLSKTFWPSDLAIIYPYQEHWPWPAVCGAMLLFIVFSTLAILGVKKSPWLFVGWFYFIGTLVPVIGLVQAGPQAMADRYTYLPCIGLFIFFVWGINEWLASRSHNQKWSALLTSVALIACCVGTSLQLRYWESDVKLLRHTVAVTPDNYTATTYLGSALDLAGNKDEAFYYYAKSVSIEDHFPIAQWNLGKAYLDRGDFAHAVEHLAIAAKFVPNDVAIHYYLGNALMGLGKNDEALAVFSKTLELDPTLADAHQRIAILLAQQNKPTEAISHFREVVRLQPNSADSYFNLGFALLNNHQPVEAEAEFIAELKLTPNETKAHFRLAQALEQQNKWTEAAAHYQTALKLTPDFPEAKTALEKIYAEHPELKPAP